jgi:hypothetical protein
MDDNWPLEGKAMTEGPARTADGLPVCDCCSTPAYTTYDLKWIMEQVTTMNYKRYLLKPNEAICDRCFQSIVRALL